MYRLLPAVPAENGGGLMVVIRLGPVGPVGQSAAAAYAA